MLPTTQSLTGPFVPTSDQSWLTIGTCANGVVNFSFTANTGPARTAHITLLGQQITVSQAQASTSTTISAASANPNPSTYGQALIFTATVKNISGTGGTPTGTVTFYCGSTSLATHSLVNGKVSFSDSALPAGSDLITATYNGSANFSGSSSAAVSQTVNQASTSTSPVGAAPGNANPSTFGQALTFTATVSNASGTTAIPTGTVTFFNGATSLGTRSLSKGLASLSILALPAGSYSITATYNGTNNFVGSSSPTGSGFSQTVNQASTSTAVNADTSNAHPSTYGQTLTFQATVANTSGTGTVPNGTVNFYNGSTYLGDRWLVGGVATLTLSSLPAGTASITATYNGTANYVGSSSPADAPVTQTVNAASTTLTLVLSRSSVTYGQSVTLTASLAVTAPGAGKPTGTLTFEGGSTTLATINLSGRTSVSITFTKPAKGTHTLTAIYTNLDGDFVACSSLTQTLTVS